MLIGIDMLGVQSPVGGGRESGRYGRQLVGALLAGDPVNRYVLYTHEGLSTDRVPSSRNAFRASLAPISGHGNARRASIQRLLDQDPDGLDWLILLDPFEAGYDRQAPEAPLNGPRVASVVHDLTPALDDDRRLAPLRRHDALFAVSEATAAYCRRRLGVAGHRVSTIGLASEAICSPIGGLDPLTRVSGNELGRMGIWGPFLLAVEPTPADLSAILDAYRRLSVDRRRGYQLAIAGQVPDPSAIRATLRDRGSDEGLVLVGEVGEESLRTLYGRCTAFLAPSTTEASCLSLVEAMRCGAPVIAGRSPARLEIVGDAGLLVDPSARAFLSAALEDLITDADLERELRRKSLERSARFSFEPVVEAVVSTLGLAPPSTSARTRVDRAHLARPRIAVFPNVDPDRRGRVDLAAQVPAEWAESYAIDLYLEPGSEAHVDGLPPALGGFDARLFARNDAIMGYHSVVYRVGRGADLDLALGRLQRRPGLVFLLDHAWLDRFGPSAPEGGPDEASGWLREVFRTGSRVVVPSPRHLDRVVRCLPDYASQVVEIPPAATTRRPSESHREAARARLDLLPGSLVIGQFGAPEDAEGSPLMTPRSFKSVARAVPEVILLSFGGARAADEPAVSERFVHAGPVSPDDADDVIAVLDLAIHAGQSGPVTILDLLKAGVPTIAVDSGFPEAVVRNVDGSARGVHLARAVRELASDLEARSALGRSALAYSVGLPDAARASSLLIAQLERAAAELPRIPGRRRRPSERPRGPLSSPHFPRPASERGEAASSLQVEVTGR